MKFFTKQLWESDQDVDSNSDEQWDRCLKDYLAQLEPLRTRLAEADFSFFSAPDVLHGAELMELTVRDGSRPAPLTDSPRPWLTVFSHPVQVETIFLDAEEEFLWTLEYSAVRKVVIDFPSDSLFRYENGHGFGDWGYHELSETSDGWLRHEVLFASGSVLLFEFQRVELKRAQARP